MAAATRNAADKAIFALTSLGHSLVSIAMASPIQYACM